MWKWVKLRGPEGKFAKMNETLSNWVKNCENYLNVKKLNETMWNRTKHCATHGNIMKLHETLWKIVQPKERSRDHFWNQRLSQNWSQSQRWNRRLRIRRIKKKIVGNYCPVVDLFPPQELDGNRCPTGDFSSSLF